MINKLIIILLVSVASNRSYSSLSKNDCNSLILNIISPKKKIKENQSLVKHWSNEENIQFIAKASTLKFTEHQMQDIIKTLNKNETAISTVTVNNYLQFVLTLKEKKLALDDLNQLESNLVTSKYVKAFLKNEEKINIKMKAKNLGTIADQDRYHQLFYGCKSFSPNEFNQIATQKFKKFSLSLSLGTLAANYSYYNMDKEINAEWFEKLGYDLAATVLFSYINGKSQAKVQDTQIVKSLKNYLIGRVVGFTDILIYDPLFNNEGPMAISRIEKLKEDTQFKQKIDDLLISYQERGIYRKLKDEIINKIKKLPYNIGLGLKGNSIDENNVDWNDIKKEDLDRLDVQEVLVAAAMAQVYQETHGEWIDTSDSGLDHYVFNGIFYGIQLPRSAFQTFLTYQMLCMGQDNAQLSFTKAALFNVATNFIVNYALYDYRQKAIGY